MATTINLTPFGFEDTKVHIEGDKVDEHICPGAPLVFLFDEQHNFTAGIAESLKNACTLIDQGIVGCVGVEGYPQGMQLHIADLLRVLQMDTPAYIQRLRDMHGTDDAIVAAATEASGRLLFGETLFLLRPQTPIDTIEDPVLYRIAGEALQRAKGQLAQRTLNATFEIMMTAIERTGGPPSREASAAVRDEVLGRIVREIREDLWQNVQNIRDAAMTRNLFGLRERCQGCSASILNAGRWHQEAIATELRDRSLASFIRMRPSNYPLQEGLE